METRRAGVQQLLVMKEEEDATEQQECSSSLDQEGQEPPLIKEEPEEEDLDQIKEEATQFSLTPVQVKSEVDGATSSWTQHMKTEADGDTCGGAEAASDLDTPLLPDHQRSPCSDSVDSEDRRETIDPESASNSMEDQNVHLKMPHGSTNKHCNNCNAVIAVACKTCKICQAEQPRRQRLAKRLKTFEKKKEEWLKNQKKNNTASRVMDEAQMLLEKLHALGHRAVVFLARPGKKAGTWSSQVVHSKWHLTGQASKCLDRMKDLYEVVVTGWTDMQPPTSSTIHPSTTSVSQPSTSSTIHPSTTSASQPSTSSTIHPSTTSASQPSTSSTIHPSTTSASQPSTSSTIHPSTTSVSQPSTSSTIHPSTTSASQPSTSSTIHPSTTSASQPSTSSTIHPSTTSVSQPSTSSKRASTGPLRLPPRKSRKTEDGSKECSHMVGDDGYYPVKRVVKTKHQKGKVMKLIEWEPCSMCGKSFPLQWVPKAATKR
ncbi:uncharacterized protein LOC128752551 isoform X1 [Synchiropus splendidus]|uniref:uncharacterized protein LOC128752551 isoform X1 n=1 Tax=Synchiropus splendidus TaxID=270530 RepID=UPI00237E020C|nr:uncharacterized protein LOC128752551 isoform X1 [Synchiropus splendidus]